MSMAIPKVQLEIYTIEQERLVFMNPKKIIHVLRGQDDRFDEIRLKIAAWSNEYYFLPLSQITKETLIKKYIELMSLNQLLIDEMQMLGQLYQDAIGNSEVRGRKYKIIGYILKPV